MPSVSLEPVSQRSVALRYVVEKDSLEGETVRLTLRTLLAYRDGVLSPTDSEDLHRRIQQSEDAGNLLKRINSISGRVHDASPTVVGKGLGGDPNSYAEYLDDVLQGTKVPELERICLESDLRLAELATCHSLLASAMHTRVKLSDSLRQIAMDVGSEERRKILKDELKSRRQQRAANSPTQMMRVDPAHPVPSLEQPQAGRSAEMAYASAHVNAMGHDSHAVRVQAPMVASGGESIKEQGLNLEGSALAREVPEYLVGANSGNWRMPIAIGTLAGLLGVLLWLSLPPFASIVELFSAEGLEERRAALREQEGASEEAVLEKERAAAGAKPEKSLGAARPNEPVTAEPAKQGAVAGGGEPVASSGEDEGSPIPPDAAAANEKVNETPADPTVREMPAEQPVGKNEPIDSKATQESDVPQGAATNLPPVEPNVSPTTPLAMGGWVPATDQEQAAVLLAQTGGQLYRLSAGDAFSPDMKIIVPPGFRTTLQVPGGVAWTTCGASRLTMGKADSTHLTTSLCRGLIHATPSGKTLRLESPSGICNVTLLDATSTASIEVAYRPRARDSILDRKSFLPVLVIIAAEGHVQVDREAADDPETFELAIGDGLAFVAGEKPEAFKLQSIPTWYSEDFGRPIDKLAAADLSKLLVPTAEGSAVDTVLSELTKMRRPETAAIAIRTSILGDAWPALVNGFLRDRRQSSHWDATLALAEQVLAADVDQAGRVKSLFSGASPKGETLFQMFVGLTKEQLASNGLVDLIAELDAKDLESRVLAIYQLRKLTGKTLGYLPASPSRASVQQWRREQATNRLAILPAQDLIWERTPR